MNRFLHRMVLMGWIVGLSIAPLGADTAQVRFRSPSGRFDLIFRGVEDQWSFYHKAVKGLSQETRDLYSISVVPVGEKNPVNAFYYADSSPAPAQNIIFQSMLWSPGEHYMVLPDKVKAREGNHVFQLVVPTENNKVWNLVADHVSWIDDHRFVGDLNTAEVPGGIMLFDAKAAKADLVVPADNGIGYQITAVHDHRVTVKQFLNKTGDNKTTWDLFTPACFDLDLDTLKKRSVPCPSAT